MKLRSLVFLALPGVFALPACGSSSGNEAASDPAKTIVTVHVTGQDCRPDPPTVPAGAIRFDLANAGADSVSEVELMKGKRILGEKENLTPGLTGSFTLRLEPGDYEVYCPGAKVPRTPFTVSVADKSATATETTSPLVSSATAGYQRYVIDQAAVFQRTTKQFTDAVRAGDVAAAKRLYPTARYAYETIEPVAESFGDLDPSIDARENDVASGQRWTGYHRIEKALWGSGSAAGMTPYADQLDADAAKLAARVATETYQPAQLANGAVELLGEVARSKVTGEEERYSHTDLWDFAANVDGAGKAFELLRPAIAAKRPDLAATLDTRFADVRTALAAHRRGQGYADYATVGQAERRVLAQKVDALAEPLSGVAAVVA